MFLIVPSAFLIIYAVLQRSAASEDFLWMEKFFWVLVIVLAGLKYSIYTSGGGTWLKSFRLERSDACHGSSVRRLGGAGFSSYSERHRFHWIVPVEEMGRNHSILI